MKTPNALIGIKKRSINQVFRIKTATKTCVECLAHSAKYCYDILVGRIYVRNIIVERFGAYLYRG